MCLAALAFDAHPRWAFVVAANRDEFHARAAAPLAWWHAAEAAPNDAPGATSRHARASVSAKPLAPAILAGRDLQAGGTWLGLNRDGRFALLTNLRRPQPARADAPSRGQLPTRWLRDGDDIDTFWHTLQGEGHAPFNLIAADLARERAWWLQPGQAAPQPLARGLHGLSNASLGTPWPKVLQLNGRLEQALHASADADALAQRLFDALADDVPAPDADLPDTGVPRELERTLSSAFIRAPERGYGTRCSTVVIAERTHDGRCTAQVIERSYDTSGVAIGLRREHLRNWPPRGR